MRLSPAQAVAASEEHESIRQALNQLEHDERTILLARHVDGLSSFEIGKKLEMPPSTVRGKLQRASARLKACSPPALGRRHASSELAASRINEPGRIRHHGHRQTVDA